MEKKQTWIIQQTIPNNKGVTGDGRVCVYWNSRYGLINDFKKATRFNRVGDAMKKCVELMEKFRGVHFKVVETYI